MTWWVTGARSGCGLRPTSSPWFQDATDSNVPGASETGARAPSVRLTEPELGEDIQESILRCLECQSTCLKVVDHYFGLKNEEPEYPELRLLLNCSEICVTAARFMLRGSDFCHRLCQLCAEVCRSCAQKCRNTTDNAEMAACELACQRCAECCERMVNVAT